MSRAKVTIQQCFCKNGAYAAKPQWWWAVKETGHNNHTRHVYTGPKNYALQAAQERASFLGVGITTLPKEVVSDSVKLKLADALLSIS